VRKKRRKIPLLYLLHGLTTLDAFRKKACYTAPAIYRRRFHDIDACAAYFPLLPDPEKTTTITGGYSKKSGP
jgi:hypothetical protein